MRNVNELLKAILEVKGELPPKSPPKNIKKILSQIELFEMYPRIFALVIKDDKLRGKGFYEISGIL